MVILSAFALNDRKSGFFGLDYLPNDGVGWKLVFGSHSVTSFLAENRHRLSIDLVHKTLAYMFFGQSFGLFDPYFGPNWAIFGQKGVNELGPNGNFQPPQTSAKSSSPKNSLFLSLRANESRITL